MATKTTNTPDQDQNPVQDYYNQEFGKLTSDDNYKKEGQSLYEKENETTKNDLSNLDESEKQKLRSTAESDNKQADSFYGKDSSNPAGQSNFKAKISGAFAGKRKYGWIGGGIIATTLGIFTILGPALGPLHIFNNLFDHNFELNDSFRRQRTSRIMRSIFSNNKTNRNLADTPFKLKADLVDFEKFETRMASRGWNFDFNADGKPIGLIDPDGVKIDLDGLNKAEFNRRIDPLIKDTIPAWQMNKRTRTRSLISVFTGPTRAFNWTDLFSRQARTAEPDFEIRKFKKEAGLDEIDIRSRVEIDNEQRVVDENGNEIDRVTDPDADVDTDIGLRSAEATIDAKYSGATDAEAIRIGLRTTEADLPATGRSSLVIGGIVFGCIAKAVYENDLISKFERYTSAIRYGATFMLGVNELQKGGDFNAADIGGLYGDYAYSEQYDTSFADSAAWQRATGEPETGPELNDELRVNPTTGVGELINEMLGPIGSVVNGIPGFNLLCDGIFSVAGAAIGLIADIVEGALALGACLTGAGCVVLGKFIAAELLFEAAARLLAASLTSFIGFLTDNPAMALGLLDQSLNLISSEESRTATPVDSATYNSEVAVFKRTRNKERSITDRYFATNNPQSFGFALAEFRANLIKTTPGQAIANIFKLPKQALASAFTSGNVYAQTNLEFDNYDFQKYVYDESYLESDAYKIAEEVEALINADPEIVDPGEELPSNPNQLVRDFAMYCMGYNPDTGLVNKGVGTTMLPVYSNPYGDGEGEYGAEIRNELFQELCIEKAIENSELYSKIGRYVDDIELISSMIQITGGTLPISSSTTPTLRGSGEPPVAPSANECDRFGLRVESDEVGQIYCVDGSGIRCQESALIVVSSGVARCPNSCESRNLGFTFDETGTLFCVDSYGNRCNPSSLVPVTGGGYRCSFFTPSPTPAPTPEPSPIPICPPGEICIN